MTNCARTGDFNNWCVIGDTDEWNVTNAERVPSGAPLGALGRSVELDTASQRWSEYLVDFPQIFHSDDAGLAYGENVAYNPKLHPEHQLTSANAAELAATLMQQWMDSPSHRVQIMYPHYETFGVGVAVEVSPPSPDTFVEIWGTQQFQ